MLYKGNNILIFDVIAIYIWEVGLRHISCSYFYMWRWNGGNSRRWDEDEWNIW
jgi:hypothetical protein